MGTRAPATVAAVVLIGGTLTAFQTFAAPSAHADQMATADVKVPGDNLAETLGEGWQRSEDRAWATSGDGDGFHIMVAEARDGYRWRTATTLSEPGLEADQWIGNACATGSGDRLVVTYAPRTFTNREPLFTRGGFSAVVDLATGGVTKLPVRSTLAYYSPACGTGESAVLTQAGGEELTATRLIAVDTAKGVTAAPVELAGQVTSAVPIVDGTFVAADRNRLVRITPDGRRTELARTEQVPFRLTVDARGGVVFLDRRDGTAEVKRFADGKVDPLARGPLAEVDLTVGAHGTAFITGRTDHVGALPATVKALGGNKNTRVSTNGELVLRSVNWRGQQDPRVPVANPVAARAVDIAADVVATGKGVRFVVEPGLDLADQAGAGRAPRPAGTGVGVAASGSPSEPAESERTCSVPRNDPRNQVMQPKPRQVEWAVDQAVRGALTVQRPENWKNLGMPAYTPQGLFPPVALEGGGYIPAQVMLGITAQESNMWQASPHAVPGVTGNPLIGNYYGRDVYDSDQSDDWDIRWDKADCGYGITQMTDGMRLAGKEKPGETAFPYQTQRAIALDFAANVAAGVQTLQKKWNETRRAGLMINDGKSQYLENWFFAVWAYNSGFYPQSQAGANDGAWGVGWLNNPVNPHYPANRDPFLERTYEDAAHPQHWPYPEKVLGFAGHPVEILEAPNQLVHGFRPAWWPGDDITSKANRAAVKPPVDMFCDASNKCEPGAKHVPNDPDVVGEPAGPCAHVNAAGQYDLKCWYNQPTGWKAACSLTCGRELLRFDPGYAYQDDGTAYPPNCSTSGLPSSAIVVDDVPDTVPSVRPGCDRTWTSRGSFTLDFAEDAAGLRPSKVDFHQAGGGFGAHFWFAHTRTPEMHGGKLRVTGTWRPAEPLHGWTRIKVHIPDQGAWTRQARYTIELGDGRRRERVVNQAWQAHTWVDIGVFPLAGDASVRLNTITNDGKGEDNVAFDAVAFIPTTKPAASYVALGDSYSSGEGIGPYFRNSDYKRGNGDVNACHRSQTGAYPTQVKLPGHDKTIAQEAAEGTASFAFLACSGAITPEVSRAASDIPPQPEDTAGHTDWGLYPGRALPYQRSGEVIQTEQGYLDEDTTLVTLSVGGNDVRFAEVMRSCTLSLDRCFADDHKLTRGNNIVDPEPLKVYEKHLIQQRLGTYLKATYRDVHAKAPNAQILVVGYPQLFADRPLTAVCPTLGGRSMHFLNTLADLLTIAIADAVAEVRRDGVNIRFLNPTHDWRDGVSHWACGGYQTPWTAGIIPTADPGSGRETPGRGSFHPTAEGQKQLAAMVNTQLHGVSPPEAVQQRIRLYVDTRTPVGERWVVSDAQALEAARRCLDMAAHGGVVGDPCMTLPVIFPSTGNSAGAALNDQEAITANPPWVRLNFVSNANKAVPLSNRSWMNLVEYAPNPCSNGRPTGMECDEYPYYSSELGGAWDRIAGYGSPSSTRLRLIPRAENNSEGIMLRWFYPTCGMTSGTYDPSTTQTVTSGSPYLTIPLIGDPPESAPFTFYVC